MPTEPLGVLNTLAGDANLDAATACLFAQGAHVVCLVGVQQVIDVLVSVRRDADAARRFFRRALATLKVTPTEVVTDAAAFYPAVLDELIPQAWHHVERYANNPIEADHSQLKHRLRSMRGLRTDRTAQVIIAGHAFMQNLRRGHYEIATGIPPARRVAAAFAELATAI
ncbi:DDE-type integrase/transposase/recombinase [Catellatospora citrea]|uniref:DDE-type integrase/transposase/recombinase n=1 Tax=Catellatospora citrea TaxID=53366 RepID=UPI0033D77AFC